MATQVGMPKLGLTMQEGTIVEWKAKEGERVQKGEILYVIETEKVTFEVEAPDSGILGKIVRKQGDVVPVGGIVAYIIQEGESLAELPEPTLEREVAAETAKTVETTKSAEIAESPEQVRVSPVARKLAQEHNIDITTVRGSGPGGRIVKEDILQAVEQRNKSAAEVAPQEQAPVGERVVPLSSMRKTIAKRLTESFQTPHFYQTIEIDMQEIAKVNEQIAARVQDEIRVRLTYTDWLIKMVAKALEDHPALNSAYDDGYMRYFDRIHIGMATSVEGGLIVPVIRDANKKTLKEICLTRTELIQKARDRTITAEEISGSTFTITNVGVFGIDQGAAIINPPEAAILNVCTIKDRPVVRDGQIAIRPMMNVTIAIDHRVLDGHDSAQFLNSLKQYMENPCTMLL